MRFVGIDPGSTGATCILDPVTKNMQFMEHALLNGSARKLHAWLQVEHHVSPIQMSCVEDVHSLHGMSAKSNFSFGFNTGMVRAVADIAGFGVALVQPKVWQKAVNIAFPKNSTPAARKKITAQVCIRLYPDADIVGPKGGLRDGKADALMIAHYIAMQYSGLQP